MTPSEFHLNQEIKCLNAIQEFEKGIEFCLYDDEKLLFTMNWVINYKYLYKSIIIKPLGRPAILFCRASDYENIAKFYKTFRLKNIDIISDEELDSIANLP